jgi:hypothetical protein
MDWKETQGGQSELLSLVATPTLRQTLKKDFVLEA